jgi:hypothetical protein
MSDYFVSPHPEGWAAKREGASKASNLYDTQREAIERARNLAINSGGGEVSIQGRNGQIREKNSYGNDPYPPRG